MFGEFLYGIRLRGFSPGCQPKKGFVRCLEVNLISGYHDLLVYDRMLTQEELDEFELDYLGNVIPASDV